MAIVPGQIPAPIFAVRAFTVRVTGAEAETEFVGAVALNQLAGQFALTVLEAAIEKDTGCPVAESSSSCEVEVRPACALKTSSGGPAVKVVVLPIVKLTVMTSVYRFESLPVGWTVMWPT
jgi:hypothetical protein